MADAAQAAGELAEQVLNGSVEKDPCGLSPHDFLEVKFFLISVVGSIIGLFGLFGNVSTALILTRPSMRNPNNLYLTALAIFDSCLLITAFFIYGMEYIIEYTQQFQLYVAWLTYLRFAFALSHISQTGSVYITVTVTIERFFAVCFPKESKQYCSSGGAAWTILGVTTFAVLFNATKFFELEVIRNPECSEGMNWLSYILRPSAMARNDYYARIYGLWVTNTVMVFFPFCCLLVLNSVIAYTIKRSLQKFDYSDPKLQPRRLATVDEQVVRGVATKANGATPNLFTYTKLYIVRVKDRHELKEKSREATLVLITIVFIFLICNFWGFVLTLLEQILPESALQKEYHTFYTFSREAINFLAIINSSINFVIYIIFGKDFRKELIIVYGCGMRGMTVRLPAHDKFSIWRTWTKRVDIRRSISMVRARRKSHAVSMDDAGRPVSVLAASDYDGADDSKLVLASNGRSVCAFEPSSAERLFPLIDDNPRLSQRQLEDSAIRCVVNENVRLHSRDTIIFANPSTIGTNC